MEKESLCTTESCVCVCKCVCPWDQMKNSSESVAIDQSSTAPMMDTSALIAPPMPSVSLTHTLLHSHLFIYLSSSCVFFSSPLLPSPKHCSAQTETNRMLNKIKLRGMPARGAFVSCLLTAAAAAHLHHLTDSSAPRWLLGSRFQTRSNPDVWKTASRRAACRTWPWGKINHQGSGFQSGDLGPKEFLSRTQQLHGQPVNGSSWNLTHLLIFDMF